MAMVEIAESHDYDLVGRVVQILETQSPEAPVESAPVRKVSTGAPLRVLS